MIEGATLEPLPERNEERDAPHASGHERVISNSFIYLACQLATWTVAILSVSIIPRTLGEASMGQMQLSATILTPFIMIFSLSIDPYLTAECGRNPARAERIVRATLGLRLLCIPLLIVCSLGALSVYHVSRVVWIISAIGLAGTAIGYVMGPMRSILAGWEQASRVARIDFCNSLIPIGTIPFLGFGVIGYNIASLLLAQPISLYAALCVRRRIRIRPTLDLPMYKSIVRNSVGFLVNDIVQPFYNVGTVTVLHKFTNDATLGVFSQSQRLLGTFMFVPSAIGLAILPALSRMSDSDAAELERMQKRVIVVMVVFSLPIMLMAWMLADPFCHLLYGKNQFLALPLAVKASAFCVLPLYVTTILYRFLIAQRRQGIWSLFMVITAILNAVLCYILVPITLRSHWHNGVLGAVLATAGAEAFSMALAFVLLKSNPFDKETLSRLGRALLAAAAMACAMWLAKGLFFVLTAFVGLTTFGVLAWKLHVLGAEEQEKLGRMVQTKLKPLWNKLRNRRSG